jgi:hypothetical protein
MMIYPKHQIDLAQQDEHMRKAREILDRSHGSLLKVNKVLEEYWKERGIDIMRKESTVSSSPINKRQRSRPLPVKTPSFGTPDPSKIVTQAEATTNIAPKTEPRPARVQSAFTFKEMECPLRGFVHDDTDIRECEVTATMSLDDDDVSDRGYEEDLEEDGDFLDEETKQEPGSGARSIKLSEIPMDVPISRALSTEQRPGKIARYPPKKTSDKPQKRQKEKKKLTKVESAQNFQDEENFGSGMSL